MGKDIEDIIEHGIIFKGAPSENSDNGKQKVKTKAKKKKYITGTHGSGSALQKAKYRLQRANRKHKGNRKEK
ncbi:MAG: hypothetical protein LKG14_00450 [Prevotella sp.]|jgi:hypothetical protein|uniref:Uncharacterized protein n=1 Tax=Segatella cerevisiae TaxID=2053716 RepID=A0ABT1BZ46_9BACT|nr:hypothetical protein [Segatella cerevisiae]MCH3994526.1 hypothetical protein [Prevotella sp.]MCI1245853.1 hypothetical protein [Prevotella sp.]MCO6026363.1 hypothetical protein [Segatella cerevisiae]